MANVHHPPSPDSPILSPQQIDQILAIANQDPRLAIVHDVVVIIYGTGIRSGELSGLLMTDIDTAQNRIHIAMPNSIFGERYIPLTSKVLAAIIRLHFLNPDSRAVMGDNPEARLMRTSRDLGMIAKMIGAGNVSLHTIRASFAARQRSGGANLESLRVLMGHSSVTATYRYYNRNSRNK